jgi:hypothetical protein
MPSAAIRCECALLCVTQAVVRKAMMNRHALKARYGPDRLGYRRVDTAGIFLRPC